MSRADGITTDAFQKLGFGEDMTAAQQAEVRGRMGALSLDGPQTIAFIGDSTAAIDVPYVNANYSYIQLRAPFHALNHVLRQKFRKVGVFGFSGQRSSYVLSQFDSTVGALVPSPGWVMISAGANNVTQIGGAVTVAAYKADMIELIAKSHNLGARVIINAITPPGLLGGVSPTTAQKTAWIQCNQVLRDIARDIAGVIILDWDRHFLDLRANATIPQPIVGYADGTYHPTTLGSFEAAVKNAARLNKFLPDFDIFAPWAQNLLPVEGEITRNPFMYGTAGTLGSFTTGVVPDNYTVTTSRVTATDGSTVVSRVPRTDLGPTGAATDACWLQVTYTGPTTMPVLGTASASDRVAIQPTSIALVGAADSGLRPGDMIQVFWEFEMDTPVNFLTMALAVFYTGSTGIARQYSYAYDGNASNNAFGNRPMPAGILSSDPFVIPPGTTVISIAALGQCSAANGSFTARLGRVLVHKLS